MEIYGQHNGYMKGICSSFIATAQFHFAIMWLAHLSSFAHLCVLSPSLWHFECVTAGSRPVKNCQSFN